MPAPVARVGYIVDNYFPHKGSGIGGAKNLRDLISEFHAGSVDWRVFTRVSSHDPRVIQLGPPYRKRGYGRKILFNWELWRRRDLFRTMDLVHSQSASSIPFLWWLRRHGIPTLFDCRNSFVRGGRLLSAFHLLALAAFPPSHVVFVDQVSLADYHKLVPHGAAATYIPVPVTVGDVEPLPVRERVQTVLFATQLATQKGFVELLTAVQSLWNQGADFTLEIAGDGPLRGAAEQAARRWPGRLKFRGLVPFDDISGVVAGADLLVQPSLYESVSLMVLEAMSLGVPAIATAAGGMRDVVEADLIECVRPRDPRGLALAISGLSRDRHRRQDLSQRGWQYVREHHDWKRVLTEYQRVFAELGLQFGPI
jgi:glycosyltransferase involved in cell wall biosynthesis